MNCGDIEQLLDAHLDGELSGALRLEFEAHRLRCRRCQHTLALMEAVTRVIATDRRSPAPSDDFTDRVMQAVATAPRKQSKVLWKIGLAGLAFGNAAAIAALVYLGAFSGLHTLEPQPPAESPTPMLAQTPPETSSLFAARESTDRYEQSRELVLRELARQLSAAIGPDDEIPPHKLDYVQLVQNELAHYANLELPAHLAAQSRNLASGDALGTLLGAWLAPEPQPAPAPPSDGDIHSL